METRIVVGREREIDALDDVLDHVTDGPCGFVLEGEAGIGKTTLWREAVAGAVRRGYRVLACRPVESEAQLGFAALEELLATTPEAAFVELPGPQRQALEVALLRRDAGAEAAPHPRAVALGALGVIRTMAGTTPVVIAVDDAQWLDRPSAGVLEFIARRLEREPVVFVLAQRSAVPGGLPLDTERALGDRMRRVPVGPIDVTAMTRLLGARLDRRLPSAVAEVVHATAAGNPFLAVEIAQALLEHGRVVEGAAPLPVPAGVQGLVGGRLAGLPSSARDVALLASALSRPTDATIAAARGSQRPTADLAVLVDAGVLEIDGARLQFTHPLLRSVVYGDAEPEERRTAHARLAQVLDDPEERARHLVLAAVGPDASVAAAVEDGARSARARGAAASSAALWDEARRLTPADLVGDAGRRAVEAAERYFETGETERAREILTATIADAPASPEGVRARVLLAWIRAATEGYHVAAELFQAVLDEGGLDGAQAVDVERGLAWALHETGNLRQAEAHSRSALARAEAVGRPELLAPAIADIAFHEAVLGEGDPLGTIGRAIALDGDAAWRPILGRSAWIQGMILEWAGQLDAARDTLAALYQGAMAGGDGHAHAYIAFHLSRVELLAGNWGLADRYADECQESMVNTGQENERPFALAIRAIVAAHRGRIDEARAATDEGIPVARKLGVVPAYLELLGIRGFLELSLGDAERAEQFLGPLVVAARDAGFGDPAVLRYHGDAAETLLALGRRSEAVALITEAEDRGTALGRAWTLAIAARGRAQVAALDGDLARASEELERALGWHDDLPEPFERGRTLLALGTVRRRDRQKRSAREALDGALEIFDRLGAQLWAERARAERARISGRPAEADGLTPTEQRVADLLAAGLTYREVGEALFISPKTVQWNVSKIYRKLGVRSRAQLAAGLEGAGKPTPAAADDDAPAAPPVPG